MTSIQVNEHITKLVTRAGWWLWIAIAVVGLLASVLAELIRVRIRHDEDLRKQFEAAQQKALKEREAHWREETSAMLVAAKKDITTNLENTISGFERTQKDFSEMQMQVLLAKQSLIENGIQHMHEIILAGQPLTSLALEWRFKASDASLRQMMAQGQQAILENAATSQAGSPEVPFDLEEYTAALIPLLSWVGSRGEEPDSKHSSKARPDSHEHSLVVLIPPDESFNTILSLGMVSEKDELWWSKDKPEPVETDVGRIRAPARSNTTRLIDTSR